nr:hypothetical protein [Tanacetum cinerariifolium]
MDMQKNLALIAKYFKKIYKPTNNNLRTSPNARNKNVDNTPRLCDNDIQDDQNDVECEDEQTSKTLEESNSVRDSCLVALQTNQTEFEKYKACNDCTVDYDKLKHLKAQFQDKNIDISELKKLIKKCKGKSVGTKFDKPFVVRQPNAPRIPKPSVLGKPAPFLDSLERKYFSKTKSVPKTNVSKGVNHKTNVSKPQHKSTQIKDTFVPNNSQVKLKKTEVEDYHMISSISNKIKSVTACNDNLKSKTSNVNVVCATCEKCLIDSDHFDCVTKILNDVNARTKKPNVVPISTRKPKGHANKSVATPPMKKVASKTNTQKPKSYYRMLYEKTSNTWKW